MKGCVLSTGCPGLYLYAVKDSRVLPEIDLIYGGPFSRLPIKSMCVPVAAAAAAVVAAVCVCPSGIQIPFPPSRKTGALRE